jgi:KTSC domain
MTGTGDSPPTGPHGALALRGPDGRLLPGSTANPSGRPRGLERIARDVVEKNGGFEALMQFLADVAIGKLAAAAQIKDRLKAADMLCERGYGKPKAIVEIVEDAAAQDEDVSEYSLEQLMQLREILRSPKRAVPDVVDAEIVEPGTATPAQLVAMTAAPIAAPVRALVHTFKGSSNIARASLDLDTSIVAVTFVSGATHRYANVTRELFEKWVLAPSAGHWYNATIRKNPQSHPEVK